MITGESTRVAAPARSPGSRRRAATWAVGTAVAALALFAGYLGQSRTVSVGSDGASQALQAWDLLHGNLLLHGWWVTDVSFYTTELPQYAMLELAHGLTPDVMHVGGAMTYTLLVLAAAFLARGRARGPAGLTRALLAAGIMLAPQLGPGTETLVLSPDHVGTAVPVLLVWLLIDRAPARWYVPVLVWLALAWVSVADTLTLFIAVIPLALVCALRVARGVRRNSRSPREHRYELALLAAAVLATPTALAATALIRALGGWQVNGLPTALAAAGQLAGNARLTGEGLLELFGANVFGAASAGSALGVAFALVHLAGVALAAAGLIGAATAAARGRLDLVDAVLLTGLLVNLAAYLAGVQAVNITSTREIAPALPFAAALAGRQLGGRLLPGRRRAAGSNHPAAVAARRDQALRYALIALLACYAAMLGDDAAQPPSPPQYANLAAWLSAHHLTEGLSGYHQANIVTLETGGAVTLRAVTRTKGGLIGAYTWNASARWFDPAASAASFLVLTAPGAAASAGGEGMTAAAATATFGRPSRTYRHDEYVILVWPRGENLLARLRTPRPLVQVRRRMSPGASRPPSARAPASRVANAAAPSTAGAPATAGWPPGRPACACAHPPGGPHPAKIGKAKQISPNGPGRLSSGPLTRVIVCRTGRLRAPGKPPRAPRVTNGSRGAPNGTRSRDRRMLAPPSWCASDSRVACGGHRRPASRTGGPPPSPQRRHPRRPRDGGPARLTNALCR